jgi:hypothetical protein
MWSLIAANTRPLIQKEIVRLLTSGGAWVLGILTAHGIQGLSGPDPAWIQTTATGIVTVILAVAYFFYNHAHDKLDTLEQTYGRMPAAALTQQIEADGKQADADK